MRIRVVAVILAVSLCFATLFSGCGSSGRSGGNHAVIKSVVGAAVVHHVLKKRGSKHALLKSVAAGAVIHHFVKK